MKKIQVNKQNKMAIMQGNFKLKDSTGIRLSGIKGDHNHTQVSCQKSAIQAIQWLYDCD